jgi:hypothetical protein
VKRMTLPTLKVRRGFPCRCCFASAVSISVVLFVAAATSDAAQPPPQDLRFDIIRKNEVVGHHQITFRQDGDNLVVHSELKIAVQELTVTVFRYEQTRDEVWRGQKLVALASVANDDGTRYDIKGKAGPSGLNVISGDQTWTLPPDSLPASYWNLSMVTGKSPLVDAQSGRILPARAVKIGREAIKVRGKDVDATHYRLGTRQPPDIWYDASGRWVKMRAVGRDGSVAEWVLK